ncbi:MAG: hypothetical protein NZ750_00920 [Anaerolineae bacterium]|nr:hypothetical protein [Anaerolineae bacterium]MDW8173147.1 hypothetical protein [Anaerolineae bacterium]
MASKFHLAALAFMLVACQSNSAEQDAMRQVLTTYPTESAALLQTMQAQRIQADATIQAADSDGQRYRDYTSLILATVRANQVPTPSERLAVVEGGAMSLEMLNITDDQMRFMQIGMAGYVNPSDDCFETHQQYYTQANTRIIYMTALAINLKAGTNFTVNWLYNRQRVFQSSWTAPRDELRRCIAIPMRSSDVTFQAGSWTAELLVNGRAEASASFEIRN